MEFVKKSVLSLTLMLTMLIASSALVNSDEITKEQIIRYRLPNNSIPRLYNIDIEPNIQDINLTWVGTTTIDIEILNLTRVITLHAYSNILIHENLTQLVDVGGGTILPTKHVRDDELEFLKLEFEREINVGNYSLRLKYDGFQPSESRIGFYRASGGRKKNSTIVGTHFEPTAARRAFPCWDEPGLKARFRVSIKHFPNYTAVSNMPGISRVETDDGKILSTFDTTPIMSIYLLTLVIADYKIFYNTDRNASLFSSLLGYENARHVLDLSPKIVQAMESYTGFSFGIPVIGSVLLPWYSSAATEHWGLISYREEFVSFDASVDTTVKKDAVDMLIAHELAHSWFGNRVSPLWWDDLWLNEAFAAYFQYFIMDEIYNNWGGVELFILRNNHEVAFVIDGPYGNPVRWTPITNEDVRQLFAPTTYRKGAAIVHMFRNVFGDNVFRAGIQKFLAKHSFGSATANDLMAAFQEAYDESPSNGSPLNVTETMTPWLVQRGYPIISVSRNYTSGMTEVSQKSSLPSDDNDVSNKWCVPLTYATKSNPNFTSTIPTSWISNTEEFVEINGISESDWIVLNLRASGYYRVNYDAENWNRLAEYLDSDDYKNIDVLNRAQLISEAHYLTESKSNRYYKFFYKLTKYLYREVEYLPWRAARRAIEDIEGLIINTRVHAAFKTHYLRLMQSFIEKVGFEVHADDDHFTKLARTDVIQWACMSGHSKCSKWASKKLLELMENPEKNRLHPDIRSWIFCAGLRGLNDTATKVFAKFAYTNARSHLITHIGCTNNHEIHRNILNNAVMNRIIGDPLELTNVVSALLGSSDENFNFTVDYFVENYEVIDNTIAMDDGTATAAIFLIDIPSAYLNRARLEKLDVLLRLDAVRKKLQSNQISMTEEIESKVRIAETYADIISKSWDLQLPGDNAMTGNPIEHH